MNLRSIHRPIECVYNVCLCVCNFWIRSGSIKPEILIVFIESRCVPSMLLDGRTSSSDKNTLTLAQKSPTHIHFSDKSCIYTLPKSQIHSRCHCIVLATLSVTARNGATNTCVRSMLELNQSLITYVQCCVTCIRIANGRTERKKAGRKGEKIDYSGPEISSKHYGHRRYE